MGLPVPNLSGAEGPNGVTVSRDGRFLFVTNQASSNVSVFRIGADGQLMLVSGSPFSTGGGPDAFPLGLGEAVIP